MLINCVDLLPLKSSSLEVLLFTLEILIPRNNPLSPLVHMGRMEQRVSYVLIIIAITRLEADDGMAQSIIFVGTKSNI
jgi:hypothetical protein